MLPQMMPLPWLLVFILVFICFFTVSFIVSSNYLSYSFVSNKKIKSVCLSMPW